MELQMVAREYSLTPFLHEHLQRCLRSAFTRARRHIARIVVRLDDLNDPRGGRDKVCHVNVVIPGRPEVSIREVQENMCHAIDCAVKRAANRTMRLVMRERH